MTLDDIQGLTRAFAPIVADAIKEATRPLLARIAELEKRPTAEVVAEQIAHAVRAAVEAIPKPRDGADADPAEVKRLVDEAVAALPPAKDGQDADPELIKQLVDAAVAALPPAKDGKDADPELIRSLVDEAVAALPPAEPGKDADPAEVKRLVEAAVAALPAPKDGKDCDPAEVKRLVDEAVAAVPKAKDGVGLAGAIIDRNGELVVTLTDGSTRDLGPVVGKPGDPGQDGVGFDDLSVEFDGERTATLKFVKGEREKTFELVLPHLVDRDVWKEGAFQKGDCVTFGGSYWTARKDTEAKPGEGDDWRMTVRKGRDGRSLYDVARARGFTGNETEFVELVIGKALARPTVRFGGAAEEPAT